MKKGRTIGEIFNELYLNDTTSKPKDIEIFLLMIIFSAYQSSTLQKKKLLNQLKEKCHQLNLDSIYNTYIKCFSEGENIEAYKLFVDNHRFSHDKASEVITETYGIFYFDEEGLLRQYKETKVYTSQNINTNFGTKKIDHIIKHGHTVFLMRRLQN